MTAEKIVKRLREEFGDRVIVRTEHHIQVDSDKGYHNIWVTKDGYVRFKKAGNRPINEGASPMFIVRSIKNSRAKTDVQRMKEMLDVATFVGEMEQKAQKTGDGIYTDAGYKEGEGRVAAMLVCGEEIHATVKKGRFSSIEEAESTAIEIGICMRSLHLPRDPGVILPVYNDNKVAVGSFAGSHVYWLPREATKAADKLSNMRGKGAYKYEKA